MDLQTAFNIAVGLAGMLGGWVLNTLWAAIRDMQKADKEMADKVAAIEVLVAGQYVTRVEHQISMSSIAQSLQRIEDKLNAKADKN